MLNTPSFCPDPWQHSAATHGTAKLYLDLKIINITWAKFRICWLTQLALLTSKNKQPLETKRGENCKRLPRLYQKGRQHQHQQSCEHPCRS